MIRIEYIRWLEKKDKDQLINMLADIKYKHLCNNCRFYCKEESSCLSLFVDIDIVANDFSCNEFIKKGE